MQPYNHIGKICSSFKRIRHYLPGLERVKVTARGALPPTMVSLFCSLGYESPSPRIELHLDFVIAKWNVLAYGDWSDDLEQAAGFQRDSKLNLTYYNGPAPLVWLFPRMTSLTKVVLQFPDHRDVCIEAIIKLLAECTRGRLTHLACARDGNNLDLIDVICEAFESIDELIICGAYKNLGTRREGQIPIFPDKTFEVTIDSIFLHVIVKRVENFSSLRLFEFNLSDIVIGRMARNQDLSQLLEYNFPFLETFELLLKPYCRSPNGWRICPAHQDESTDHVCTPAPGFAI
ncbi:hypothetical protein HGRIS_014450 [Hohenbuehelia grisea]